MELRWLGPCHEAAVPPAGFLSFPLSLPCIPGDVCQQQRLGEASTFISLSDVEALKWLLKNQAPLGSAQSRVRLTAPGIRRRLLFPWRPLGAVEATVSCAHRSLVSSLLPGAGRRPCGEERAPGTLREAQQHREAAWVSGLEAQWCPIFGGGPEPCRGTRAEARHAAGC